MSETNNNKIDIRKLLNENNIPTPNRQKETDVEKIVSNVPAGFDKSLVENASDGIEIENAEILKNAPMVISWYMKWWIKKHLTVGKYN